MQCSSLFARAASGAWNTGGSLHYCFVLVPAAPVTANKTPSIDDVSGMRGPAEAFLPAHLSNAQFLDRFGQREEILGGGRLDIFRCGRATHAAVMQGCHEIVMVARSERMDSKRTSFHWTALAKAYKPLSTDFVVTILYAVHVADAFGSRSRLTTMKVM